MNEVLVLKRTNSDADDGMFACYQGVTDGYGEESIAVFWEGNRAKGFLCSFLREVNKSLDEYRSTEEVIEDFLRYCQNAKVIGE